MSSQDAELDFTQQPRFSHSWGEMSSLSPSVHDVGEALGDESAIVATYDAEPVPESHGADSADVPSSTTMPATGPRGNAQQSSLSVGRDKSSLEKAIEEFLAASASSSPAVSIRGVARKWQVSAATLHRHVQRERAIAYRAANCLPLLCRISRRGKR